MEFLLWASIAGKSPPCSIPDLLSRSSPHFHNALFFIRLKHQCFASRAGNGESLFNPTVFNQPVKQAQGNLRRFGAIAGQVGCNPQFLSGEQGQALAHERTVIRRHKRRQAKTGKGPAVDPAGNRIPEIAGFAAGIGSIPRHCPQAG